MTITISTITAEDIQAGAGISVADLLRRLGNLMVDEELVRWTEAELIDWINDAASEIVLRRPAARAVSMTTMLEAGTLQRAPDGSSQILDVVRNIGAGSAPGRAIRITDRQQLDAIDPEWHSTTAGATRHYMLDERAPTTFYVYPPAVDGAQVEMLVAMPPPKVTDASDALDLRPEFISAILNWMMYRCHTKDSEYAQGAVATQHYQAFTDAIGAPKAASIENSATGNSV